MLGKPKLVLTIVIAAVWLAGCSAEHESGFKSSRPEFDQELRKALTASSIPFREEADGFIRYSSKHEAAVEQIKARIEKEMSGGIAWKLEDEASREYLKTLLGELGMKYWVQPREDGVWIQWNPKSEAQKLEVQMKVAQFQARAKAARQGK